MNKTICLRIPIEMYDELKEKQIPLITIFRKGWGILQQEDQIPTKINTIEKSLERIEHSLFQMVNSKENKNEV